MNNFEKGKNREEKIDKFLDVLTWYFSEKNTPTGFYATIGKIDEKLGKLNENIEQANNSSEKLTKALNKITLAGVIISAIGILVAIGNLFLEIYRYFKK
jgi:hypothetical protein